MKKKIKNSALQYVFLILVVLSYGASFAMWYIGENIYFTICYALQVILSLALCIIIKVNASRSIQDSESISVREEYNHEQYLSKVKEVNDLRQVISINKIELADAKSRIEELQEDLSYKENTIAELVKPKEVDSSNDITSLLPKITEEDSHTPIIDIISIANEVTEEFIPIAEQHNIRIQISTSSRELNIKAAPSRLKILFKNIIDNSIKYMNKSGVLVITISNIGSDIFIVLKDNGNGLSESETSHIFELNYQGSNRVSGNGLGLTQSKAIVEYYGGTIYAKSNPNSGMGIYIQLPLV